MYLFNHKQTRKAFTMIELIFVIVIMGVIGKFGVEFLAQAYKSYIFTSINTRLEAQSEVAVEFIAARLQERIKDSVIARKGATPASFELLSSATGTNYTILEWVGNDIDGFRADADTPNWSGIIDLDLSSKTILKSPQTNTGNEDTLIQAISGSSLGDAALYFIGSNGNKDSWGWAAAIADQNQSLHPIKAGANADEFISDVAGVDFTGVDLYEYYKLSWSAYSIVHDPSNATLTLYYDYQPWQGDAYGSATTKSALIMDNVSTFRFKAIGSTIKIQVCVKSDIIDGDNDTGGYSICKEKTIF